jgi:hypothetical protein
LDSQQRTSFYAAAHSLTGPAVIKKAMEMIEASESHGEYFIDGGEFLPLSVWATRGFDQARILQYSLPADIREDRVLGTTYRVKVLATGNKGEKMTTRTSQCKRKSVVPLAVEDQSSRPRLALEDAPTALPSGTSTPLASESGGSSDSTNDPFSDDSSSSSSSSVKDKKKNKKGKKGKKGKKDKNNKKNKKGKKGKKGKKVKKEKKDEHRGK